MTVVSRRQARRQALILLFQSDLTGRPLGELYDGDIDDYARQTAEAVLARAEDLDRRISDVSEGWPADRLGAVERNVLRIALHELDGGDVPAEVAIDEAVEAAKELCSAEAPGFVNGILGAAQREEVAQR